MFDEKGGKGRAGWLEVVVVGRCQRYQINSSTSGDDFWGMQSRGSCRDRCSYREEFDSANGPSPRKWANAIGTAGLGTMTRPLAPAWSHAERNFILQDILYVPCQLLYSLGETGFVGDQNTGSAVCDKTNKDRINPKQCKKKSPMVRHCEVRVATLELVNTII